MHAALRKLSPDDRVTIVLVYVAGPRSNKVLLTDIADWCDLDVEVLRKRVTRAEYKVAEALDTARMRRDAANDAAKAAA